jgi:hypothetical protein
LIYFAPQSYGMILKIFKAVWFFSLLALLTSFLFIYASVPEQVIIHESSGTRTISREALFYSSIALFSVCNVTVFIISSLYKSRDAEDFLCWIHGLLVSLNIFFIIALNFINLYNSNEKFNFGSIGYVIYGSVVLVILWTVAWPVYTIFRKRISKPII